MNEGISDWKNTTSYSKGADKSVVRTTEIKLGDTKLVVTRYVGFGDELVMSCNELNIRQWPLGEVDMAKAQHKALGILIEKIENLQESLTASKEAAQTKINSVKEGK